jgi:hypothetical protein
MSRFGLIISPWSLLPVLSGWRCRHSADLLLADGGIVGLDGNKEGQEPMAEGDFFFEGRTPPPYRTQPRPEQSNAEQRRAEQSSPRCPLAHAAILNIIASIRYIIRSLSRFHLANIPQVDSIYQRSSTPHVKSKGAGNKRQYPSIRITTPPPTYLPTLRT